MALHTIWLPLLLAETDLGKAVAASSALIGVLLMNVPIAFVLLSFDEVYKIRKDRELRARKIVDKLFEWVDRARFGRRGEVLKKSQTRTMGQHNAPVAADKRKTKRRRSSFHMGARAPLPPEDELSRDRQIRSYEIMQHKKSRHVAKNKLLDIILHPHHMHKYFGNKNLNGRQYYLVSKYATKWQRMVALSRSRSAFASPLPSAHGPCSLAFISRFVSTAA